MKVKHVMHDLLGTITLMTLLNQPTQAVLNRKAVAQSWRQGNQKPPHEGVHKNSALLGT